ncbi:hypothetical protein [Streptomyces sp. Z26]|uniref:hypothetical protein n=1 Tax=Streptomyces TaxID=1883 RepID=UPI000EF1730B|nr:hypothetical protein [Streptomyces sp. Z26]RLL70572.1 hypothetical protein D7M15_18035 [Streptomyces sp. Z26]
MAGLTACGSDDDGGSGKKNRGSSSDGSSSDSSAFSPLAALKKASDSTEQQKSARVEGNTTQGTPQGTQTSVMQGVMDWSDGGTTGDLTVTQSGGAVANSPIAGKPTPTRYTADAMYVNMGDAFASTAGKGAHWIAYDYDKLAELAGPSGAFIKDQMQNNNPSRSVQLLLATGKVKKVGTENVKGAETTHYSGTVKVADLARMQSQELSQAELQGLQEQLQTAGLETEKIDLWIDGDDLLVKKSETARNTKGQGDYESVAYYSDYGTDVTVEAPAGSDTVDFAEVS